VTHPGFALAERAHTRGMTPITRLDGSIATGRLAQPLPIQASDIQGLAQLAVDAVVGITGIVEAMHHTIVSAPAVFGTPPAGRTSGITGLVYGAVRGSTRLVGTVVDRALKTAARHTSAANTSAARDAVIAALNGVWGDHLADTGNPLAIPMSLRVAGRPLDLARRSLVQSIPHARSRLLVLVHGLCMNDRQWTRNGHDHGAALAHDLGYTPLYLHYNSGRHVSHNGRELAALLERLLAEWPAPIDELVLVGHSMGGLVIRSACHAAEGARHGWLGSLTRLVFLGTPHHGATLERGGRYVDALFGASPYSAPFARIGKARSAGITDLRFGNVQDADWTGRDRHRQKHDERHPTPLPPGVCAYVVAGCVAKRTDGVRARLLGDGLVPVSSALGDHADPARDLGLAKSHRRIVASANHWDLLDRADVYRALRGWVGRVPGSARRPQT